MAGRAPNPTVVAAGAGPYGDAGSRRFSRSAALFFAFFPTRNPRGWARKTARARGSSLVDGASRVVQSDWQFGSALS